MSTINNTNGYKNRMMHTSFFQANTSISPKELERLKLEYQIKDARLLREFTPLARGLGAGMGISYGGRFLYGQAPEDASTAQKVGMGVGGALLGGVGGAYLGDKYLKAVASSAIRDRKRIKGYSYSKLNTASFQSEDTESSQLPIGVLQSLGTASGFSYMSNTANFMNLTNAGIGIGAMKGLLDRPNDTIDPATGEVISGQYGLLRRAGNVGVNAAIGGALGHGATQLGLNNPRTIGRYMGEASSYIDDKVNSFKQLVPRVEIIREP